MMRNPAYSICMCNYNMADTIERSLTSILDQLDDRFEVVVVDDGSTDNSVDVIRSLQLKYSQLRLVVLKRDAARKLGLTRNISIEQARGEYVLPQLDCDDVYLPHIQAFVAVFHQLERCLDKDFYLKGQKLNIGKREFLLKYGPYRNLFRGEDRDLWERLVADDAFVPIMHMPVHRRLPKPLRKRLHRAVFYSWDQLVNDFRKGAKLSKSIRAQFENRHGLSLPLRVLKIALAVPAWWAAQFEEPLPMTHRTAGFDFARQRDKKLGTFAQLMEMGGCVANFDVLPKQSREIFK